MHASTIIGLVLVIFALIPGAAFAFAWKRKGLGWTLVGISAAIVLLPWGALFHS